MIYLILFIEFFKIGLFAVGGGLATLPFLYALSDKYSWLDAAVLPDMIAISESTPGPIGVNMATYAGYSSAGVLGGIIATLGLITPSVIVIILVAKFLNRFNENFYVQGAFYGLRPAVTALIALAGFEVFKVSIITLEQFKLSQKLIDVFDIKATLLFVALLFITNKTKKHPIVYILGAAIVGILFKI
ncbi:chromate transporter [Cellulosilyticum sp. I15G10I2]|uniref:chromate transporter n=1 Tax=Cellulosilyticum sp. I15G10I2 TaxID=1892843 RepID=UPI00085BD53D|nr:chromate transporter [Cellulosilyticum sp. I15G10I2]